MGITIEAYRSRIGLFAGGKLRSKVQSVTGLHFSKTMLAFAVLTVLLHIGGIESNPGPATNDDIMKEMKGMYDSFMKEFKEVRVDIQSVKMEIDKVKSVCEMLKETCNDLKKSTDDISKKVCEMDQRMNEMEMQQEANADKLDTLHCENEGLKTVIDDLGQEIDQLESRSRRENLRFFGLDEDENDSYEQCATTLVNTLNKFFTSKTWTSEDIARAHRVGRKQGARNPRHLIAKFVKWSDVDSILKNHEAREKMKQAGLRVSTDLTRRQMTQIKQAQADGKFAYFHRGRLVVEERRGTRGQSRDEDRRGDAVRNNTKNHDDRRGGPRTRSHAANRDSRSGNGNLHSSWSSSS